MRLMTVLLQLLKHNLDGKVRAGGVRRNGASSRAAPHAGVARSVRALHLEGRGRGPRQPGPSAAAHAETQTDLQILRRRR